MDSWLSLSPVASSKALSAAGMDQEGRRGSVDIELGPDNANPHNLKGPPLVPVATKEATQELPASPRVHPLDTHSSTSSSLARAAQTSATASAPCPPSAWWRGKYQALRQRPWTVAIIILVMACLMGLGIWGVVAAAQRDAADRRMAAWHAADEKALNLQTVLTAAFNPASIVASLAKQNPYNLTALDSVFQKIAPDILNMTQHKSVFNMQLVPNGIIKSVIPITGFQVAAGIDLFQLPARKPAAFASVRSRQMVLSGPDMLAVGIYAFVGLEPVFVPDVEVNETFSFPNIKGVPNVNNPNPGTMPPYNQPYDRNGGYGIYDPAGSNCSKSLCYIPEQRAKFWGFGKAVVAWEPAKKAAKLYDLCDSFDFIMTSSSVGKPMNAPIAMCSDMREQPTGTPGLLNGTLGSETLADYLPRDPISVTFTAFKSRWTLYVVPKRGSTWTPAWVGPLCAAVVVMAVILTFLLLLLLALHVQQLQHLAEQKAARQALEQEKLHTDALIKRQLNLIACFAESQPSSTKAKNNAILDSRCSLEEVTLSRIEAVRRHLNASQRPGDEIVIQELLGQGAFGKVYKGLWRGGEVAVKTIVLSSTSQKRQQLAIMEAAIASSMMHPNVVQTYTYAIIPIREAEKLPQQVELIPGVEVADQSCWDLANSNPDRRSSLDEDSNIISYEVRLVQEYCDQGCLREALDAGVFLGNPLNYKGVLDTACDVAKAMLHLHEANVLHSDLKARNIMLKSTGSATEGRSVMAKVADFGLSVSLDPTQTHMSDMYQGTMTHMAPEVLMKGCVSKAADVYAFGITMWELLTAGHAFKDIPGPHLGHAITAGKQRPEWGLVAPREYVELAQACWQEEPEARPCFKDILARLLAMRGALPGPTPPLDLTLVAKAREAAVQRALRRSGSGGAGAGSPSGSGSGSGAFVRRVRKAAQQRSSRRGTAESLWRSLGSVPEGRESEERERVGEAEGVSEDGSASYSGTNSGANSGTIGCEAEERFT